MTELVSMWDFSWLLRRTGEEAEYAEPAKVLDELVDRGYDTVRIDAFPHLIGPRVDGAPAGPATVLAQEPWFRWGSHEPVTVDVGPALVEFVGLAHARGVRVALASWFLDDATHVSRAVRTPADFARAWSSALALLDGEGLLEAITVVDLCNEWPMRHWAPGAFPEIFTAARADGGWTGDWNQGERDRIAAYFTAIDTLRERWPSLRYTFSFAAILPQLHRLDCDRLDLLDVHMWLDTSSPEYARRTLAFAPVGGDEADLRRHLTATTDAYWAERERWLRALEGAMDRYAKWALRIDRPLMTSEGWASVIWDEHSVAGDGDAWDYVRDVAQVAGPQAALRGWSALVTSNFSQPHFPGMWDDAAWHRELGRRIRAAGAAHEAAAVR